MKKNKKFIFILVFLFNQGVLSAPLNQELSIKDLSLSMDSMDKTSFMEKQNLLPDVTEEIKNELLILAGSEEMAETDLSDRDQWIAMTEAKKDFVRGTERDSDFVAFVTGHFKNDFLAQRRRRTRRRRRRPDLLNRAFNLVREKKYQTSTILLYKLARASRYRKNKSQIKYILGLMLMKMELYQMASFLFYDVISGEIRRSRTTKYLRQSLSKLSYLSNVLDSDVLLKYVVSRIRVKDFPHEEKDIFYYRLGELRLKEERYDLSARIFKKVNSKSPIYTKALYKTGLAYAKGKKPSKALVAFQRLYEMSKGRSITDSNRVNAILSIARVYYQNKKWDKAIEYYRFIPRDTWQWHDSIFEQTWAMMRSGRYFRSALSNFHTLHSSYYDDRYLPESLLLRSMVYLFICRYDEMGKVLNLFDKAYKPVILKVRSFLREKTSDRFYYNDLKKASRMKELFKQNKQVSLKKTQLPKIILNEALDTPSIRSNLNYVKALEREISKLNALSSQWKSSSIGRYGKRVLDKRVRNTKTVIGKQVRNKLRQVQSELRDFFEQSDFLKFEMVSAKKESLRKKLVGKKLKKRQLTEAESRDFFIANGYEYWPYEGEYWLDELGNYHYVGIQACE